MPAYCNPALAQMVAVGPAREGRRCSRRVPASAALGRVDRGRTRSPMSRAAGCRLASGSASVSDRTLGRQGGDRSPFGVRTGSPPRRPDECTSRWPLSAGPAQAAGTRHARPEILGLDRNIGVTYGSYIRLLVRNYEPVRNPLPGHRVSSHPAAPTWKPRPSSSKTRPLATGSNTPRAGIKEYP
jgi:hypothetical protein